MRSCPHSSRVCVPAAWASWRCAPTSGASASAATSTPDRVARRPAAWPPKRAAAPASPGSVARSSAVGYFTPAPDLVVGRSVQAGDLLGSIDVLGIAQEVTAPEEGIVAAVLAEEGQAVEYGQVLAEIDPLELGLPPDRDEGEVA